MDRPGERFIVSNHPCADDYRVLTFDCYGTLVDWGSGILDHLQPLLADHGISMPGPSLLNLFAELEPEVQSQGGKYADVLQEVLLRMGRCLGFSPSDGDLQGFAESVGDWEPFPDTVQALSRLASRFDLAIVSNVDNHLFARTNRHLKTNFRHVITAEEVGAYKPDLAMFDAALAAIGGASGVLHVAQSLFHDIAPAADLGLETVWIRRDHNAARMVDAQPTWSYPTLGDFAEAILG